MRYQTLNKIYNKQSGSADLFLAFSKAAALDSPWYVPYFPWATSVCGSLQCLSALFSCFFKTPGSTVLSPWQQCKAYNKKIIEFPPMQWGGWGRVGEGVGVLVVVSKVHRTWNQYSTWQRTLDAVLFARWLIGHRVNSLSIHHGLLHPAVSQTMPKTSSSEGWPRETGRDG